MTPARNDTMAAGQALYDQLTDDRGIHEAFDHLGPSGLASALERTQVSGHLRRSPDEQEAMDTIGDAMARIQRLNGRRLRANQSELAQAIHVLQGFVTQATLSRLGLFDASDWWEDVDA